MRTRHARRRAGYSFIELATVVTVLGIAGALVIPRLGSTSTDKVRWAAQQLVADLQLAQAESMGRPDDPVVMVFAADSSGYRVAASSAPGVPLEHPLEKRPWVTTFGGDRGRHLPHVVLPKHNVGPDQTLGFGTYGEPDQAYDAVILLGCDNTLVRITVDAQTARVTVGNFEDGSAVNAALPGPVGQTVGEPNAIAALVNGLTNLLNGLFDG